ncbi:hypothetical protein GUJ93_ZPchr0009g824 [Zizania palustris]|uniref:Uncharacterized protein n=1 Tax=Zizania palustris TaxID=103762 RepID=A0A8J5RWP0_ZIZPA|nr:hypothetical protein GUJ93_ZPchr0009g824 [Zizania palustris]
MMSSRRQSLVQLLLLLLLAVFFTQNGSCSRPLLPRPSTQHRLMPLLPSTANQQQQQQHNQLLLFKSIKPRGRPPPSSPSKGTN